MQFCEIFWWIFRHNFLLWKIPSTSRRNLWFKIPYHHNQCSRLNVAWQPHECRHPKIHRHAVTKDSKVPRTPKGSPKCDFSHLTLPARKPTNGQVSRSMPCDGILAYNPARMCRTRTWKGGNRNGTKAASSGRQSWQPQIIIDISKISLHCSVVRGNLLKVAGFLPPPSWKTPHTMQAHWPS